MVDQEMLAAIRVMIEPIQSDMKRIEEKFDSNLARVEKKFDTEISHLKVLLENDIPRRFDALAEGQQSIIDRQKRFEAETAENIADLEDRVVRLDRRTMIVESEIQKLKEAQ